MSYMQLRPQSGPDGIFRSEQALRHVMEKGVCNGELARFQIEDFENLAINPDLHV